MFLIANNITTRNAGVKGIFRQAEKEGWDIGSEPARELQEIARQCAAAGAHALEINTQQHFDKPEAMEFGVKVVQKVTDLQLCLSTNSSEALDAGLLACKHPPLVNYLSLDEARLREMLPVIVKHGAGAVILVSDPSAPADAREMLQKAAILVGAASGAGILAGSILVDPGLIHITSAVGQRHLVEVLEFLRSLPDALEPQLKTTCWLSNGSTGAPKRLRPPIEAALLPLLVGAGLSTVFLDILQRKNRRVARLIKIFNNELVYSDGEVEQ